MREGNPRTLKYDAVEYLMAGRRPAWVKHQTLVRVLGRQSDDPEVAEWQEKRNSSHVVKVLRGKQLPDGSFPCMPWRHVHTAYWVAPPGPLLRLSASRALTGHGSSMESLQSGIHSKPQPHWLPFRRKG